MYVTIKAQEKCQQTVLGNLEELFRAMESRFILLFWCKNHHFRTTEARDDFLNFVSHSHRAAKVSTVGQIRSF